MCDEGSTNYCAIYQVYGGDFTNVRVVGWQWHFKNDVNRKSKDVNPDLRGLFISPCHKICAPVLQLQSTKYLKVTWMTLQT